MKRLILKILKNSREKTSARASFLIKLQAELCSSTLFSRKFCEIFKNYFVEHLATGLLCIVDAGAFGFV